MTHRLKQCIANSYEEDVYSLDITVRVNEVGVATVFVDKDKFFANTFESLVEQLNIEERLKKKLYGFCWEENFEKHKIVEQKDNK